jgi:hypothetical protein
MNKFPTDKNSPIAIIGSGPSGIHMASLLKKEGYQNITIFEKNDRIGGKTYSIESNGIYSELGTTGYSLEKNSPLMKLIKEVVPKEEPLYAVSTLKLIKNSLMPFLPKTIGEKIIFMTNYFYASIKFSRIYNGLRKKGFPYKVKLEDKETLKILGSSLENFLQENNLTYLTAILSQRFAAYGYGRLCDMPTYYGLLLLEKNFLSRPKYLKFENGNITLWKLVIEKYQLKVEPKQELTSIDYSDYQNSGLVHLTFNNDTKEVSRSFAAVFLSTPHTLNHLLPQQDMEVFQSYLSNQYVGILAALNKDRSDTYVFNYPDEPSTLLNYELLILINFGRLLEVANKKKMPVINNFTCFLSSVIKKGNKDNMTEKDVLLRFRDDLKDKYGIDYTAILKYHLWKNYCPMLPGELIANGSLSKTLQQQGEHGLWYIGSCLTGELVSLVTELNTHLVDCHKI